MPALKNFVAIDWRSGPDRIYFFFKDNDTYSRFNIGDNKVPEGYPGATKGSWDTFDPYTKNLRFGFTTDGMFSSGAGDDIAWLFFYSGNTPMVCRYDQDKDKAAGYWKVAESIWRPILPYFDKIVAGTWTEIAGYSHLFTFLLNDGHYLRFNYRKNAITRNAFGSNIFGALIPYKDRIITAAQNDRTFADSYWYIFLTNNQYLVYNLQDGRLVSGPHEINETSWPGLLRT
ncbi:hypothetical protein ICA16_09290 [Pseudomonas anatoliensis]|uniref:hypothetical protein n=1 Tax=Pseudomonas TaxID=286 RepID=UPI00123F2E56|nr:MULTISPECIES: hypothetical protein [Pseudomonas]MBP5955854.1 hypothetical protein [Pseudomonas anatoliensis]VVO63755.1 hypothetical protein PS898_00920 [Pseudomonas fluorescens]